MGDIMYKAIFFDLGLTLLAEDSTQWNPGAQALLTQLGAASIRLGVISNTGNFTRPQLADRLPKTFKWNVFEADLILLSSEVEIEKPDLRIFQLAVQRAGAQPGECLYCSENLLETLAAQRAGMHSARLMPPPATELLSFAATLQKLDAL